jgi:hypothetical protein
MYVITAGNTIWDWINVEAWAGRLDRSLHSQFTVGTATVVIFHTVSLIIIISTISTYTRSIRLAQQAKVSYRCGSIHYQHEAISGTRPPFILLKLALYISWSMYYLYKRPTLTPWFDLRCDSLRNAMKNQFIKTNGVQNNYTIIYNTISK